MKMWKKVALCIAAYGLAFVAVQSTARAQTVSGSQSGSMSDSRAIVQQYSKGAKNVSSAVAPGLIASGHSCSGSSSVGVQSSVFGISLGSTREDRKCDIRQDAGHMATITGDTLAAKERLCDDPDMRRAYARAGRPCASDVVTVRTASLPTATRSTARTQKAASSNVKLENCLRRQRSDASVKCTVYK